MQKLFNSLFAASASIAISSSVLAADTRGSLELLAGLTECSGQLEAASEYPDAFDGVSSARVSAVGALQFLSGSDRLSSTRRAAVEDSKDAFSNKLLNDPINARSTINSLRKRCMALVYEAEDVRVTEAETAKREAAEKRQADMERREGEARANALELAKVNAETERLKIQTTATILSEQGKNNLEGKRIDSAASIDLAKANAEASAAQAKIAAETERQRIDRNAVVESERTRAGVETAKINADAGVAITGKVADVAIARESATTDRARINATATTEVAKANAQTATILVSQAAKVESEKTQAAVEIAKAEAGAKVGAADAAAEAQKAISAARNAAAPGQQDSSSLVSASLECGAFYSVMAEKAPQNQRVAITKLSSDMLAFAERSGASFDMVTDARQVLMTKFGQSATRGKQSFERDVNAVKDRCTSLSASIRM